jgi:hypothetical protein
MAIKGKHKGADIDITATDDGELIVRAINEEVIEHASGNGLAFSFHVVEAAIDTTDTVLFVKNTDDKIFVCDRATLQSDAAAIMLWDIAIGKATTTPVAGGGTTTPISLYPTYSSVPSHIAMYDETAVAQGDVIHSHRLPAGAASAHIELHGVLLGKGQYIQFDVSGTTPVVGCTLWGHWETEAF